MGQNRQQPILPKHPLAVNMREAEFAAYSNATGQLFALLIQDKIAIPAYDINENDFKVRSEK